MQGFSALGWGGFVPTTMLNSETLDERLGLESGWVSRRTGIVTRPIAEPHLATTDLAVLAGEKAVQQAGVPKETIKLVVLATSTPDHVLPPSAPAVAYRLGLKQAGAFDLAGACSGFLYGLVLADSFCRLHGGHALIIGANVLTRRVNWQDPSTASLFSDGAGAVVWGPVQRDAGLLGVSLSANGSDQGQVWVPEGGSRMPFMQDTYERKGHLMKMASGPRFFRNAVTAMAEAGKSAMEKANCSVSDLDHWIPHQANERLIKEVGRLLGVPASKTRNIVAKYGNSSAATIPLAGSLAASEGMLQPGQKLLLTSVGAGLISAGLVLKY